MRRLLAAMIVAVLVLAPGAAASTDAHADECATHAYRYDPGKTVEGFHGRATDGCSVADWTGSIGQGPGSGELTFRTTQATYTYSNGLPSPAGGHQNACQARAVQEANAYFTNLFRVPVGTEVTVSFECS